MIGSQGVKSKGLGSVSLDELQRLIAARDSLAGEVSQLRTERERLGRFKEIDAEEATLVRLRAEADTILQRANDEAAKQLALAGQDVDRLIKEAQAEADETITKAELRSQALLDDAKTKADATAQVIRAEADKGLREATSYKEAARLEWEGAEKKAAGLVKAAHDQEVASQTRERETEQKAAGLQILTQQFNAALADTMRKLEECKWQS